jgi:hypothetical protein
VKHASSLKQSPACRTSAAPGVSATLTRARFSLRIIFWLAYYPEASRHVTDENRAEKIARAGAMN